MKIIFHSNAHKLHTQRIDSPHNAVPNKLFKVDIHSLIRPQKFGTIYLKDLARVLQTYAVNFICRKVQHFQADSEYLGKINTKLFFQCLALPTDPQSFYRLVLGLVGLIDANVAVW